MNPVQTRLQTGAHDCSTMEKIADALLFLPSVMWKERKVTFNADCNNVTMEDFNSFTNNIEHMGINLGVKGFAGAIVSVLVSATYAVGAVVAAPLLAAGLALKEASFKENKSKNYHNLIASSSKLVEMQKKKDYLEEELKNSNVPTIALIEKLHTLINEENDNTKKLMKTMKKGIDSFSKFLALAQDYDKVKLELEELQNKRKLLA